jgi:hypothetical protein
MDSEKPNQEVISPDWSEARERWEDDRYDKLLKRVRKLEGRGRVLDSATDERVYMFLFGAYIVFGFVVPLLRDMFSGESVTNSLKG